MAQRVYLNPAGATTPLLEDNGWNFSTGKSYIDVLEDFPLTDPPDTTTYDYSTLATLAASDISISVNTPTNMTPAGGTATVNIYAGLSSATKVNVFTAYLYEGDPSTGVSRGSVSMLATGASAYVINATGITDYTALYFYVDFQNGSGAGAGTRTAYLYDVKIYVPDPAAGTVRMLALTGVGT